MQSQFKKTLQSVREMLAALERDAVEDGISKIELEIVDSGPRELALRGNEHALVHLARVLVDLAFRESGHYHLDEVGVVDRCDRDLVFAFRRTPETGVE